MLNGRLTPGRIWQQKIPGGPIKAFFYGRFKMSNPNWQQYEAMKQAWIKANPGATAAQYDAAIARIVKICKV